MVYLGSGVQSFDLQCKLLANASPTQPTFLREFYSTLLTAFTASFTLSVPTITFDNLKDMLRPQSVLKEQQDDDNIARIKSQADHRTRCVIDACSLESGAWLELLPDVAAGLEMNNKTFRTAVRIRLALDVYSET